MCVCVGGCVAAASGERRRGGERRTGVFLQRASERVGHTQHSDRNIATAGGASERLARAQRHTSQCRPKQKKLTADAVAQHVALGASRAHARLALLVGSRRRALAAAGDAALLVARRGGGCFFVFLG